MRNYLKSSLIYIMIIVLFSMIETLSQEKNLKTPLSKQISKFELGIRYLKLGNTYREAREFHLAKKYLDIGTGIVRQYGNKYWEATANEFFGYLYRDMELKEKSLEHLQIASNIFSKIIKLGGGSNEAINQVIESINNFSHHSNKQPYPTSNIQAENQIKSLQLENKKLFDENEQLKKSNIILNEKIAILEKDIEIFKSKLIALDKSSSIYNKDEHNSNLSSTENDKLNKVAIPNNYIDSSKENQLSNKEKELKLMKTGYTYKQGNVIVDMYGNKIYIDNK